MAQDVSRLLLHICCAPDATVGIEEFSTSHQAEGFFYNPNIEPGEEYRRRLDAMHLLSRKTGFCFREEEADHEAWKEAVRGWEDEPEKGRRCKACIRLRLMRTALEASKKGIGLFASVLTVSPRKDAGMVNRIGQEVAREVGVSYLPTDLKKRNGFTRSVELSRKYGLYRQNFCGCSHSRRSP